MGAAVYQLQGEKLLFVIRPGAPDPGAAGAADVRTWLRDRHPRRSCHASSFSIDLGPGLLSVRIKFFYRSWTGAWIPSYWVHISSTFLEVGQARPPCPRA